MCLKVFLSLDVVGSLVRICVLLYAVATQTPQVRFACPIAFQQFVYALPFWFTVLIFRFIFVL